ncbi:MAG: cobalamin biosynthesis protein CbiD [Synergistaceae bacterium]|nr:cobalamin biosynthesis protein CbiD [Synergistaceae bacterium]
MCNPQRNSLRPGLTTGTCAAAASKAYALFLANGEAPTQVSVKNLEGREFLVPVFREGEYFCAVKDSGDDKADITDGVHVLSRVERLGHNGSITFCAGPGVGVVTLPGLKLAVGEPAINPVPRQMITLAVREVFPLEALRITLSIPGGEMLAKRTFNPRLGIVGGLSILGTTGIVKPMNERALLDSLTLELSMIYSLGFREVYITFAGTGEKFTRKIFGLTSRNVIQCANFPGCVLDEAQRLGFTRAVIAGHPGKLLKVCAGSFNTHSKVSGGGLEALCTQLALMGACPELVGRVYHANTANEAAEIVRSEGYSRVWSILAEIVAHKAIERTNNSMKVSAVFIDGEGQVLGSYRDA